MLMVVTTEIHLFCSLVEALTADEFDAVASIQTEKFDADYGRMVRAAVSISRLVNTVSNSRLD